MKGQDWKYKRYFVVIFDDELSQKMRKHYHPSHGRDFSDQLCEALDHALLDRKLKAGVICRKS